MTRRLVYACLLAAAAWGASAFLLAAAPIEKLADGLLLPVAGGFLRVQVKTDAIVRVLFSKDRNPRVDHMTVVGPGATPGEAPGAVALNPFLPAGARSGGAAPPPKWTLTSSATTATIATATLRVAINLADGAVSFADAAGRPILAEAGGRRMTPATVQGESTYNVQQTWRATAGESLYGLGQRQEGKLDIKGYDLDLWQRNTVVEIPFLVSSRGYGILWDNTSPSKFGDTRPFEPLAANLDEIVAPVTGDYQFQTYSNLDIKLWLDGQLRIDHWKQNWATEYDQFKIHLDAGKHYPLKVTSSPGATLRLAWKTPPPTPDTSLWSEVGEAIDYS